MILDNVVGDIEGILLTYPAIDNYIAGLKKERAEIERVLWPKTGASMVKVVSKGGKTMADPTGRAVMDLTCHPKIIELDRLLDYWQKEKEMVEQLLPLLTETELQIVKFYFFEGPPDNPSDMPKMSRKERRQVRRQIIEKAARCWGLINKER